MKPSTAKSSTSYKTGEILRERLLEAASELFSQYGYERISIRQIAQRAGCSQMAMYRHFPDKQALMSHLCLELYRKFTSDLHAQYDHIENPCDRIRLALRNFIELSAKNPHHYRMIFLDGTQTQEVRQMRMEASEPNIGYIRKNLRLCLPAKTPKAVIDEKVNLILALVHGITVMLVVRGASYGLDLKMALKSFDSGYRTLLSLTDCSAKTPASRPSKLHPCA